MRRESWAADFRPSGAAGDWALDRLVAASLRIEQCERALEGLVASGAKRARLAWDEDREAEAATLAKGLAKAPGLVSRQLATSYHGAGILIETWERLGASLAAEGEGWTDAERSTALDLLGIPPEFRRGTTPVDDPAGGDPRAFRAAIAAREIDRLDALRSGPLAELDDLAREQAMQGDSAMLGKAARLVLRYENDAWRRYRESLRELRGAEPAKPAPAVAPARPAPRPPSRVEPKRPAPPKLPAACEARIAEILGGRKVEDLDDAEFERIVADLERRPGLGGYQDLDLAGPTERTQFAASRA